MSKKGTKQKTNPPCKHHSCPRRRVGPDQRSPGYPCAVKMVAGNAFTWASWRDLARHGGPEALNLETRERESWAVYKQKNLGISFKETVGLEGGQEAIWERWDWEHGPGRKEGREQQGRKQECELEKLQRTFCSKWAAMSKITFKLFLSPQEILTMSLGWNYCSKVETRYCCSLAQKPAYSKVP